MDRRNFLLLTSILPCLAACGTLANTGNNGPGMTVTFSNGLKGRELLFDSARTAGGAVFPNPGGLAPDTNPLHGGATMGAAPDGRDLPEWVEFEWREPNYRESHTREQLLALPIKKARVMVRSRIPQNVVDEVLESNRKREPHKLAEKSLWVYFIWYESGIGFRWELQRGCCEVLRAGGDDVGK